MVDFAVVPERTALVNVDMLNCFVQARLEYDANDDAPSRSREGDHGDLRDGSPAARAEYTGPIWQSRPGPPSGETTCREIVECVSAERPGQTPRTRGRLPTARKKSSPRRRTNPAAEAAPAT
jgi:hypothetical protein